MPEHYAVLQVDTVLLTAQTNYRYVKSPLDGFVQDVYFSVGSNLPSDAVFDVMINGTSIWAADPTLRPKILSGASGGQKLAINAAIVKGDVIRLDVATMPAGGLPTPFVTRMTLFTTTGGGGASVDEVFQTEDDGFDAAALDAKWTLTTTGTAPTMAYNPKEARSCVQAKFGTANGGVFLTQNYAPAAADFSITVKLFFAALNATQQIGFIIADSTFTDYVRFLIYSNGRPSATIQWAELPGTTISTTGVTLEGTQEVYFHVQRVAGTWLNLYSWNGRVWYPLNTSTKSFTVAKLRLLMDQGGATSKIRQAFDWVRRDWFFW